MILVLRVKRLLRNPIIRLLVLPHVRGFSPLYLEHTCELCDRFRPQGRFENLEIPKCLQQYTPQKVHSRIQPTSRSAHSIISHSPPNPKSSIRHPPHYTPLPPLFPTATTLLHAIMHILFHRIFIFCEFL
jgi:hypothetical protein